jgi:hypothetical protein
MVDQDRRRFLRQTGSASAALPFLQLVGSALTHPETHGQIQGLPASQGEVKDEEIDQATLRFWTQEVRQPMRGKASAPAAQESQPDETGPTPFGRKRDQTSLPSSQFLSSSDLNYEPVFFFHDPVAGFQKASLLSPDRLPRKSDMELGIQILECRPSVEAHARIAKLETGSLRIDMQQAMALPHLDEPLAWSALAGLFGGSKNQGTQKLSMNFDLGNTWGKTRRLALPGGVGFWTWNFFLKEKESPWGKLLLFVRQFSPLAGPFLVGLPAIGQTALKQVDQILGHIQAMKSSRWVFQSRDIELYGTREAKDRVGPRALQLRTGQYILVPMYRSDRFQEVMPKMKLVDGRLVPKNTPASKLVAAAEENLPELTYMTLHVTSQYLNYCRI